MAAARTQLKNFFTVVVIIVMMRAVESFRATEYATDRNKTQPREVRVKRGAEWNVPFFRSYRAGNLQPAAMEDVLHTVQKKDFSIDFRPLCETTIKHIHLQDDMYEYQPARYSEIHCKAYNTKAVSGDVISSNQRCVYPGFSCMPRSQTMYFLRRNFNAECWESFTKEVPSGCDCMWPETRFGAIGRHY